MSKAEKEAAVYGHKGTTLLETASIVAAMPFLLYACESRSFVEDIVGVALPLLIAETIGADFLPGGVFSMLACCVLVNRWKTPKSNKSGGPIERTSTGTKENYLLTVLRGTTVLFTIIAILAVDFPVAFPRRYVKTEWYGAGLMDVGVGAYVFTGAIVRGSKRRNVSIREIVTTLAIGVMGFARAIINKSVDYQEHVSEYGVHWNFFVSLIGVKIIADVFSRFAAKGSALAHVVLGLTILAVHQYALSFTDLGKWVMSDMDSISRKNESLFWQNKEGIISLPGYIAIDICTRGCADFFVNLHTSKLLLLDAAIWGTLGLSRFTVDEISRRSANLPYVLWVFAIGVMLLFLTKLLVMPMFLQNGRRSELIGLFSRHQFLIFVFANLLTGAVNLTFDTLHASLAEAMAILSMYVIAVCCIAYALENIGFTKIGKRFVGKAADVKKN